MTYAQKILCTGLAALVVTGASSTAAFAQDQRGDSSAVAHAEKAKSPLLAGGLEFFVPFAGYAYTGKIGKGVLPNVVRVGGIVVTAYYFGQAFECVMFLNPCDDDVDDTASGLMVGQLLAFVGSLWASAGAYQTANDINRKLRDRVRVAVGPAGVGLRIAVPL